MSIISEALVADAIVLHAFQGDLPTSSEATALKVAFKVDYFLTMVVEDFGRPVSASDILEARAVMMAEAWAHIDRVEALEALSISAEQTAANYDRYGYYRVRPEYDTYANAA